MEGPGNAVLGVNDEYDDDPALHRAAYSGVVTPADADGRGAYVAGRTPQEGDILLHIACQA